MHHLSLVFCACSPCFAVIRKRALQASASTSAQMSSTSPIDEAGRFIDDYLREHDLHGDLSSKSLATVLRRADKAREQFKLSRPKDDVVVDHSTLTQSQKYRRRLQNNKKSAAATRVFNEVLRRESARVLRDLELSERRINEELLRVRTRLKYAEEQLARVTKTTNVISDKSADSFAALQSSTSTHPYFGPFSFRPAPPCSSQLQSTPTWAMHPTSRTPTSPMFTFRLPTEVHLADSLRLPPVPVIRKPASASGSSRSSCMKNPPVPPSLGTDHATGTVLASLRKRGTNQRTE